MSFRLCELQTLTDGSTHFGHSLTAATISESDQHSRLQMNVPWEQGVWQFQGEEKPIAGTLLIVEVDQDDETAAAAAAAPPKFVGKVDRFYSLVRRLVCCAYTRGDGYVFGGASDADLGASRDPQTAP